MSKKLQSFSRQVKEMRDAQKQYFVMEKLHTATLAEKQAVLLHSKELERAVDKEVTDIINRQGQLFQ